MMNAQSISIELSLFKRAKQIVLLYHTLYIQDKKKTILASSCRRLRNQVPNAMKDQSAV